MGDGLQLVDIMMINKLNISNRNYRNIMNIASENNIDPTFENLFRISKKEGAINE